MKEPLWPRAPTYELLLPITPVPLPVLDAENTELSFDRFSILVTVLAVYSPPTRIVCPSAPRAEPVRPMAPAIIAPTPPRAPARRARRDGDLESG
jgi:hypothetical protein